MGLLAVHLLFRSYCAVRPLLQEPRPSLHASIMTPSASDLSKDRRMRSVIFDLDGTLADTSGDLIDAANACFVALGHGPLLRYGVDASTAMRGGRAMLRLGFSRIGAAWSEAEVDAQYPVLLEAYGQSIAQHTTLFLGAMDAVAELSARGFAVGICTNKPEGLARQLLTDLDVLGAFGALVGADTPAVRKPDPAPLWETVDRLGAARDRTLLLGDTPTDRETARAAGCLSVLVTFGPLGTDVANLTPDALLDDYRDLPDLADRLLPR